MAIKQIQGKPFTYHEGEGEKRSKKEGHRLPEFELTDNDIPEIKDWSVGETITMEIEVTPIRIASGENDMECCIGEDNDDEKKKKPVITSCLLEVRGVSVKGKGKVENYKGKEEKGKENVFGEMKGGANRIG